MRSAHCPYGGCALDFGDMLRTEEHKMTNTSDRGHKADKSERAALEQEIRSLSQQGLGLTEISRRVGVSRGTVYGILNKARSS